jgi:hypothetical protein
MLVFAHTLCYEMFTLLDLIGVVECFGIFCKPPVNCGALGMRNGSGFMSNAIPTTCISLERFYLSKSSIGMH